MKRYLSLGIGLFLVVSMAGCCYRPAYVSPASGLPYGGSWEATPGGPLDPVWFTGVPNDLGGNAAPYMNNQYMGNQSINSSFDVGRQPVLPGNPFASLLYRSPLNLLFGWRPWYAPYPGAVRGDCCGTTGSPYGAAPYGAAPYGATYETSPPSYMVPSESYKPEPAPAAEEKAEPAEAAPASFTVPALLPR